MIELESSILRILKGKKQIIGTGFLVSNTLAVTCAHVAMAAGLDGENRIRVQFAGKKQPIIYATVLDEFLDLDHDIAILRIETVPEGSQPLRLGLAEHIRPGSSFRSFGYATAAGIQGILANGSIDGYLREYQLVQLQSPQANKGMSGAPVWDERRGVVIGMITKGHNDLGRNQETTFATPAELLFEACSEIQRSEICPYLGLESFRAETERFFFGRKDLTEKLRVAIINYRCHFLAVLGPSGCGKSSIVQAGLLPALKKSQPWVQQVIIRPSDNPFVQLAAAGLDLSNIPDRETVLFVDQFEEIFICHDDILERFVGELVAALENPKLILIISMRDDFYSAFNARAAPLAASDHLKIENMSGVLNETELREIIEEPADAVGVRFADGLTDIIIKDATSIEGARSSTLPLLEFALKQLWDECNDGLLTHEAYQSIGGVTGSLAGWADDAYNTLPKTDKPLAEGLLTRLVHLGNEAQGLPDTRRRRALKEFDAPTRRVITYFANYRLLVTSGETVELAHSALVREWNQLQGWIKNNHVRLQILEAVSEATSAWNAAPNNPDLLVHRGGRLDEALKLHESFDLGIQEQKYLAVCKTAEQRLRRNTITSVGLAALIVISALIGWVWTSNQNAIQLGYQAATANAAKSTAIGEANIRATAQADAETQKIEAQKQARLALARQLGAQALILSNNSSSLLIQSTLLSIESLRRTNSLEGDQALRYSLSLLPVIDQSITHDGGVSSVAFSPDGKYFVSGGWDNTARVWEIATGKEVSRMTHDKDVWTVAFSPDGKWVASGSSDQTARVWEAATGKEVSRMTHDKDVRAIAFSPDGKWIVSGGDDNTARVWEVATGKEVSRMTHDNVVRSIAFSPNGHWVVSISDDGTARVWEAATGKESSRITHNSPVLSVAFSPDGEWIVSSSYQTIKVSDAKTGKEISQMIHDNAVNSVAFSPNGKMIVSAGVLTARVWNVLTGEEISRMTHNAFVSKAIFSPDGNFVLSSSSDGAVKMWEAVTGREVSRMTHDGVVTNAVVFSPDGNEIVSGDYDGAMRVWHKSSADEQSKVIHNDRVTSVAFSPNGVWAVSGSWDDTARVWEIATGKEISHMTHNSDINSVAFSPDGKSVVSSSSDRTARVWEAATGKEISRVMQDGGIWSVIFSPDGKWVASGSNDGTARVWEAITGEEVSRMTHGQDVWSVAFSPDGKWIASGSSDGTARVWEAATGKEISRMTYQAHVRYVNFSLDGKWVVSAGEDGTVRVWEAATGKEKSRMTHNGPVTSAAFSPNGELVVSGGDDGIVKIWDAKTGDELFRIKESGYILKVIFSPDGKWIATAGQDGTIFVIHAETGQQYSRIVAKDAVYSIVFSPNGKLLLSGSGDHSADVWIWQYDDLIEKACSRLPRNFTRAEWKQYIGNESYSATCHNLPMEPEPTVTPAATTSMP